jgi:hypothetical protein
VRKNLHRKGAKNAKERGKGILGNEIKYAFYNIIFSFFFFVLFLLTGLFIYNANISRARVDIRGLETAINDYYKKNHKYPTQSEGFSANFPSEIFEGIPKDPWGNYYIYIIPGPGNNPFGIFSYGPDGVEANGVDDDLHSWDDWNKP